MHTHTYACARMTISQIDEAIQEEEVVEGTGGWRFVDRIEQTQAQAPEQPQPPSPTSVPVLQAQQLQQPLTQQVQFTEEAKASLPKDSDILNHI